MDTDLDLIDSILLPTLLMNSKQLLYDFVRVAYEGVYFVDPNFVIDIINNEINDMLEFLQQILTSILNGKNEITEENVSPLKHKCCLLRSFMRRFKDVSMIDEGHVKRYNRELDNIESMLYTFGERRIAQSYKYNRKAKLSIN